MTKESAVPTRSKNIQFVLLWIVCPLIIFGSFVFFLLISILGDQLEAGIAVFYSLVGASVIGLGLYAIPLFIWIWPQLEKFLQKMPNWVWLMILLAPVLLVLVVAFWWLIPPLLGAIGLSKAQKKQPAKQTMARPAVPAPPRAPRADPRAVAAAREREQKLAAQRRLDAYYEEERRQAEAARKEREQRDILIALRQEDERRAKEQARRDFP